MSKRILDIQYRAILFSHEESQIKRSTYHAHLILNFNLLEKVVEVLKCAYWISFTIFVGRDSTMALPIPDAFDPSLPAAAMEWTAQDSAFFDNVFLEEPISDFTLALEPSPDPNKENNCTLNISSGFATEALDNDVICMRGTGHSHPGNKHFRQLIRSYAPRYCSLSTGQREALSEEIWRGLRDDRNARFLRPSSSNPKVYEILDHEKSVRKILFALRDNRCKDKSNDSSAVVKKSSAKQVRWKTAVSSVEEERIAFENDARAEITTLYTNATLLEAMKTSWGDEFEGKKNLFEEQVRKIDRHCNLCFDLLCEHILNK